MKHFEDWWPEGLTLSVNEYRQGPKFSEKRLRGEWFALQPEDLESIKSCSLVG